MTPREMAAATGLSIRTVRHRIAKGQDPLAPPNRQAQAARSRAVQPAIPTDDERAAIEAGVQQGLPVGQIADLSGLTVGQVYRRARNTGIALPAGHQYRIANLRNAVQDMHHAEALEFVLAAWEELTGHSDDNLRRFMEAGLTSSEAQLAALLEQNLGKAVSHEVLCAALSVSRPHDAPVMPDGIKVLVLKVRRKLAGQFTITSLWAFGYRMDPAAPPTPHE